MRFLVPVLVAAALCAGCGHRKADSQGISTPLLPKRVVHVGAACRTWTSWEMHAPAGSFRLRAGCAWAGGRAHWSEPELVPTETRVGWRLSWHRHGHPWHAGAAAIRYVLDYESDRCDAGGCHPGRYGEVAGVFRSTGRYAIFGPTEID